LASTTPQQALQAASLGEGGVRDGSQREKKGKEQQAGDNVLQKFR
jgi:hypothetical protein